VAVNEREHDILRAAEDTHWWYRVQRPLVLEALADLLPPSASVLDAGCGTGGMLQMLVDYQAHGIDDSQAAVRHCRERGLERVGTGTVHALPYEDSSFDAVLSLDVLYHAGVDEQRALTQMKRVLKPGGLLVMNLPAFDCLRGSHDLAVCGARRYKACHVRQLLLQHNLTPVMLHYWNAWLFPVLLVWRRWSFERDRKNPEGVTSDLQPPPRWLNNALALLGGLDARVCRIFRVPFGSSLFVLARHTG
jgi:SAM-dependent methyltransferase